MKKPALEMRRADTLRPPANDIRHSRDDDHIEALAARMAVAGFTDPVRVRKLADGTEEVLGGWTRVLAALRACIGEIPVLVQDTPLSEDEAEKEQFLDNQLRKDFNIVEEATFYARRMERHGWSQKELAADLGISEVDVSRAMRVFKRCPPLVLNMIAKGALCGSFGPIIARLESPADMIEIAERAKDGKMKRDAVERWVKGKLGKRVKKAKPVKWSIDGVDFTAPGDMDYTDLEQALLAALSRVRKGRKISADEDAPPVFLNVV